MKEVLEAYFQRLQKLYSNLFSTLPTVSYSDRLNKSLLVSSPDEDGEVEWKPKIQDSSINWNSIESSLGFPVCAELKEYYSTYSFLALCGKFGECELNFYPINAVEPIPKTIIRNYQDGQHFFPKSQIFIVGNAKVADNDNYFICYDNKTSKLFCYESDTREDILLSYSMKKTINAMEACL